MFLYGGSKLPGNLDGRVLDIVSVFEAVGAHAVGAIDDAELHAIESNACPTIGSCAGMFTANTMASVGEALGLSLPGSASAPAVDRRRDDYAYASGTAVIQLLKAGIRPRDILTKAAFENAIAVVMALGGSTNAVLHLLAIAHEARVDLELDDFNKVAARVPHLADTKPHGKYHMLDIDRVGGVPVVMAMLAEAGVLHLDEITVTGNTVGKNLELINPPAPDGEVIHTMDDPIHDLGGIAVLTGSLAPKGSVVKVAGIDFDEFEGPARVFDGEASAMEAVLAGRINAGDIVVIRYEGPKGGPGMREMLAITGAMKGAGRGGDAALITDGRFSGRNPRVLHRPRRTGSGRRRSDRIRRGGRPHPHRRPGPHHRPARRRRCARGPQGRLEGPRAPLPIGSSREVRQARPGRREGRGHAALRHRRSEHSGPVSRSSADRCAIGGRASGGTPGWRPRRRPTGLPPARSIRHRHPMPPHPHTPAPNTPAPEYHGTQYHGSARGPLGPARPHRGRRDVGEVVRDGKSERVGYVEAGPGSHRHSWQAGQCGVPTGLVAAVPGDVIDLRPLVGAHHHGVVALGDVGDESGRHHDEPEPRTVRDERFESLDPPANRFLVEVRLSEGVA